MRATARLCSSLMGARLSCACALARRALMSKRLAIGVSIAGVASLRRISLPAIQAKLVRHCFGWLRTNWRSVGPAKSLNRRASQPLGGDARWLAANKQANSLQARQQAAAAPLAPLPPRHTRTVQQAGAIYDPTRDAARRI